MWDRLLTQNGIGGEAIIWLIIAIFWAVAQLFSRAKEKARTRGPSPVATEPPRESAPAEDATIEDRMRRFLESLGSEMVDTAPPPRPAARPVPRRAPPERPRPVVPPPPPRPAFHSTPHPEPAGDFSSLGEMDTTIDERALDTEHVYDLANMERAEGFNAFVNPRTLLVNLNYLRMNMPLVSITGLDTTSESRPRPTLHGRAALREAITNQIILSNPLAMGEDKACYTKRVV